MRENGTVETTGQPLANGVSESSGAPRGTRSPLPMRPPPKRAPAARPADSDMSMPGESPDEEEVVSNTLGAASATASPLPPPAMACHMRGGYAPQQPPDWPAPERSGASNPVVDASRVEHRGPGSRSRRRGRSADGVDPDTVTINSDPARRAKEEPRRVPSISALESAAAVVPSISEEALPGPARTRRVPNQMTASQQAGIVQAVTPVGNVEMSDADPTAEADFELTAPKRPRLP